MTDLQAIQIRELRLKGIGYRSISTVVGLSRDIVRNFCKTNGMDGYASAMTKNVQEAMQQGMVCNFCGKKLVRANTGRPRRFCSNECRRSWWKAHPNELKQQEKAVYHHSCARCGKEFTSYGNSKRKYCSHDCYIKDRFYDEV